MSRRRDIEGYLFVGGKVQEGTTGADPDSQKTESSAILCGRGRGFLGNLPGQVLVA